MSREAHVRICERLGVCLTPVDSTISLSATDDESVRNNEAS